MELSDVFIVASLEQVYDFVEDRWGRLAAWLVTLALSLGIIAALVTILIVIL